MKKLLIIVGIILGLVFAWDIYQGMIADKNAENCYTMKASVSDTDFSDCEKLREIGNSAKLLFLK